MIIYYKRVLKEDKGMLGIDYGISKGGGVGGNLVNLVWTKSECRVLDLVQHTRGLGILHSWRSLIKSLYRLVRKV